MTGYLEVDFIDDLEEDLISTDRHSLNWEHDVTRELQDYLQRIIKKVGAEWRKKRGQRKVNDINKNVNPSYYYDIVSKKELVEHGWYRSEYYDEQKEKIEI